MSLKALRTLAALTALCAASCGTMQTYEGPKRAANEIAIVNTEDTSFPFAGHTNPETSLKSFDGGRKLDSIVTVKLELLPGEHCVDVQIYDFREKQEYINGQTYKREERFLASAANLCFTAEAGHKYQTRARYTLEESEEHKQASFVKKLIMAPPKRIYRGELYDLTTKQLVASSRPEV